MNLASLLKEKNYTVFLSVKFIIFSVLCILTCFHGHRLRVVCPKLKICNNLFDAGFLYQRQSGCYILSRDVVSLDLESSISTAYC